MATVKPFKGVRPPRDIVEKVECRPYDVLSSEEARREAGDNEMSLYHIIKPEIDFPEGTSEYDPRVYHKAAENFRKFQQKGWLRQDEKEQYYIYAQSMGMTSNGIPTAVNATDAVTVRAQYGLVVAAYVNDYLNGIIKKHELTRRDKEEDRMKHVRVNNANIEPVFFAFPDNNVLDTLMKRYALTMAEYDFIAPGDGFRHQFWIVDDEDDIRTITDAFSKMPSLYIADGHHRSAAAALVGAEKARMNPQHKGNEEYNYFMAVCFQASQLTVLDYNRVVADLNGMRVDEFLAALSKDFDVEKRGTEIFKPGRTHEFALYLDGVWYRLVAKRGTFDENDPIGVLDVDISSRLILNKLLDIKDLRSSDRIDFVGGIRGLGALRQRVDAGEMRLAIALYPVSMQQIMNIADAGKIMPPKATWFEPKLRSGLIIHKLT